MFKSNTKRYICFGIIFSIFAITFALLYFFKVITTLDLYLAVVYVSYFAGIALLYNGGYSREKDRLGSSVSNFLLAFVFIGASITMLIVGLINGTIVLW